MAKKKDYTRTLTTLIDTSGDALERYVYTPYGVPTIYDATWSNVRSTSSYANSYTYTGRQLDAETGLYLYRHRFYAAQLGRFCSSDPINYEASSFHLTEFLLSNPVVATDPLGTDIFLAKGQRTRWDPVGVIHQDIAVTIWKEVEINGCPTWKADGYASYSFGVNGVTRRFPRQSRWLGWAGWVTVGPFGLGAGVHMEGEIYNSTFDPKLVVAKLETTREQDIAWKRYMDGRVGTKDRYTVIWLNCVHYTNREFQDAMNRFRDAKHTFLPGIGEGE